MCFFTLITDNYIIDKVIKGIREDTIHIRLVPGI